MADQVVLFDAEAGCAAAVGQFLPEDKGEEGTEDMASDRRVA